MAIPNFLYKNNRVLLKELTKTDFKLRYQGSVLGYLWALLRPLLLFAILYIVFAKLLKIGGDIPHYPVYLLTGTVLWSFFTVRIDFTPGIIKTASFIEFSAAVFMVIIAILYLFTELMK